MKKRSALTLSLVAALSLATAPLTLAAQRLKPPKPAMAVSKTISGMIKGAPTGKTFVLASRGATTTVDASKAKIRVNGKFAGWDAVKSGTQATATGTMQGTKLMANEVNLHPRGGTPTPVRMTPAPKKPR